MKWALVLALVLCCGSTWGQTADESGETKDNSGSRLVKDYLLRNGGAILENDDDQTNSEEVKPDPVTDDPTENGDDQTTSEEVKPDPVTNDPTENGDDQTTSEEVKPDPVTDDPTAKDLCKDITCQNGIECKEGKCPCGDNTGLSGNFCEVADGCDTILNSTCDAIGKGCIYDPKREKKATCDCEDDKKFDGTNCSETCEDDPNKCPLNTECKLIDGYSFCVCKKGLTGDKCNVITDCQPSGKYENCTEVGGNCTYDGTNSVCICKDNKEYDTLSNTCRDTCDPTNSTCANGANCEVQDGKNFCTCVAGLTGDFCQVITDCQKGRKYENCTDFNGHNCTFSKDTEKAFCECAHELQFDIKKGQCAKTCEDDNQCAKEFRCGEPIEGYSFCVCKDDFTGYDCNLIKDCLPNGKYANCLKEGGKRCWHNEAKSICECKDKDKQYDTKSGACRATCDPNKSECANGAICEVQDGKNFCTCAQGLTGDFCKNITACETGGTYEKCSTGGGTCSFTGGQATCVCETDKQFDKKRGQCRSTCDENTKKCEHGAKCEDQSGQKFCNCVKGLAGDLCDIINECQPSGKYEKCKSGGGTCTFSGGNASCSCGTGKLFDLTVGQCKDACGSVICRNGAQCKDGKCECPTGLSGTDCGTVDGCTEDLKKICKTISSKCIYDSKKEKKASCECTKDNEKFDGENCKDCSCGENEVCFFDEKKEKQCPCIDKFSKNNGTCQQCDCGEFGTCTFVEGNKTCNCDDTYKEKKGICDVCDCGEHGTCSFDDNGKKNCACKAKFADNNGTCVDCECGEEAKSCKFNNGVKTCNCNSMYEDNNGTCSECNCGEINKEAKSCKFNKGVKECDCVSLYAPEDGICTDCGCGNTTVVEGCEFKDAGKICKCKKNFSQKDESCEVCDCGKYGKCSFVNGVKTCACNDRYKDDQGTCKMCDCGENGECVFLEHEKACDCKDGFEVYNGKCEECDCGDDGTCSFVDKKKNCTCDDGSLDYNGKCTKPCKTNDDCQHATICKATQWGSFCDCKKIFSGHKCENVVACETGDLKDCQKTGGKCSYNFTQNKAVCECDEEKKFDEVKNFKICRYKCKPEEATCKNGAKCQDELCVCLTGTSGDDCSIVDVCDTDFKAKCEKISAKCVYDITTNNATCQCSNNDLEYKDDKCTPKWCDQKPCTAAGSVCVYFNLRGFYSAFCKCTERGKYYDYATNNCIDVDKCLDVSCEEIEHCTGDGKCVCDKNYEKEKDECKRKEICDSKLCSLNATCQEGKAIGTVKCECPGNTYFNAKSKTCEVMIKEDEKCKDEKKDCGPFGYCKGDPSECVCKKDLAVRNETTGLCNLNGQKACLSKKVLSNNPQKCDCSGMFKDSTNGITCEYLTCGDEAAQKDCKSKGAYCVDTENSNKQKTYKCACSVGQTFTTDKGCVDACSWGAGECSKNQQTCYLDENGSATCKCPPGFTESVTDGKTTCKLNVQFSYLLKELPVMKKEFLNKDQSVNKVKLNQYVIKSMKAVSSESYELASVQNFRISDDVLLCDVWLKFKEDAEQDVKRWRSQVVHTNDSIVLPPSLKLSSVELGQVTYEKVEFCSPLVYQTVCGRQGSKCDNNACSCMDGYDVVGTSVQVIEGNTVMRCEDIDECKENKHSCNNNSECMNTIGGHYCKCKPGFHKKDQNESEECVELCSSNPCNNGDCAVNEKENRVECSCKAGFKGSYCTESDDKLKQAQHSTKVVGAVLGTILAVTFVAIIAYVVKLKKNSYSEDFSTSPRDNSEMAERPQRGISNRGYQ